MADIALSHTHLVTTKCIPIFLYGFEVCPLTKAELHSLDFAVTRFLLKLFKTSSVAVIKSCCRCFGFKLPNELLEQRFKKFMSKRGFWPCTRLLYETLYTYIDHYCIGFYFVFLFLQVYVCMHDLPMCWWIKIDIYRVAQKSKPLPND